MTLLEGVRLMIHSNWKDCNQGLPLQLKELQPTSLRWDLVLLVHVGLKSRLGVGPQSYMTQEHKIFPTELVVEEKSQLKHFFDVVFFWDHLQHLELNDCVFLHKYSQWNFHIARLVFLQDNPIQCIYNNFWDGGFLWHSFDRIFSSDSHHLENLHWCWFQRQVGVL